METLDVGSPASEILSQTVVAIIEIIVLSSDILVKKESFKELAAYLELILPILKELKKKDIDRSEALHNAVEILSKEIKAAKKLTLDCSKKSKVYLLMNSRTIAERLEKITRGISQVLGLLPLASLDLSLDMIEQTEKLCDTMRRAEFKAAIAEEEIFEKIDSGIQERNFDRSYANNLMILIAEAVGIPTERSTLKKEFEDFKIDIENAQLRKDQSEAIQMDQIIALLEMADSTSTLEEKELKYFTKRNSLGTLPLEPLQSFYCPITRDVMVDPVETSSGQTFERNAIEKWFADGNKLCPMTMTPLNTSILRPNKTLRQSIEEWKDRNTMIIIANMKSQLLSEEEENVLNCLPQLQDLCEQRDLHRQWVTFENYIPILIELLGAKNADIRNHALVILCILTKDSDDTKEKIGKVENAVESIVCSLGRRIGERKLAVSLLLELSKSNLFRDRIGKVQGCILLLVTMASSDDSQSSKDAQELLQTLSFSDQNVIQMAKANYFKHFLQRLSSGPEDVKMAMATTLAEIKLTDHNKASLLDGGALDSLLHLISHTDIEMKKVAVKALQNLSSLPKNGIQMIREGAVRPLLDLLFSNSSSSSSLCESVASTIMHLAVSTVSQGIDQTQVSLLESDEDIFKLFSLIKWTEPSVQQSILQTFHTLCQAPSATIIKKKLTQYSAVQTLVQLCEIDDINIRANAVKLFCCLVEDGDNATILEHVGQKSIEAILKIITSSTYKEEIASAMGIISNLPEDPQITRWLLDAGALPIIVSFCNCKQVDPREHQLIENAVGAISRFTSSANQESKKQAAEAGIIPMLVQLLEWGTPLTKKHAAISLARFSGSSSALSRPIPKRKFFSCMSAQPETTCTVHGGICTIESSFCLVEADAIRPLVRVLGEPDPEACEASLDALLTLIEDELLQNGSKVLSEAKAIQLMVKYLSSPYSRLQEKALSLLERIFRLVEYKQTYGPSAQMALVDITQRGSSSMKSLAARTLAHLNVLHDQSSYF